MSTIIGKCKHYNGITCDTCKAGVKYDDVTPDPTNNLGKFFRMPCMKADEEKLSGGQLESYRQRGTCELYCEPTPEEIAEEREMIEKAIERQKLTFPLCDKVREEHKGADWSGIMECPVCQGQLHVRHHAYNGHVWGKCETEGCVSWME